LIGNGPSIVYNNDLGIAPLTTGIVAAFTALAGTDAGDALEGFAAQIAGQERHDFEGLLGPLDAITQALPLLGGVAAPFEQVDWVAEPLGAATAALRRLHQLGVSTALGLIATRSHGQGEDQIDAGPRAIAQALIDAADGDRLTLATLNYDGLLLSVMPDDQVADLASGQGAGEVDIGGGEMLYSWPLRTSADFPEDRAIHLLHLHGSLGWFRRTGSPRKFRIDDLRAANVWARIAEGELDLDPVVVLTDRKEPAVGTHPFSLGYRVFGDRLVTSSHWCVAGYSFLDAPVNQALADAAAARHDAGLPEPHVLVLGYGDVAELQATVGENVGEFANVYVDGDGLPGSVGGDAWQAWVGA
jgi:hypothetical protein